ncbi:hypothetical protein HG530_005722 [Fusarium avenaceum]|nr:hypothetical protein HG530_005722 [Fusarium avenaceum]
MNPAEILKPKGDDDVKRVITYAHKNKVSIAIKSGGHQYSGASSCGGNNVQLDLSNTYKDMRIIDKPTIPVPDDRVLVFAGGSVPMCVSVVTARPEVMANSVAASALLGDHITDIRMINNEGEVLHVNKDNHPDLFYAVRGGSPGNFGVVTHYHIMAYKAKSYMGIENTIQTPKGPQKFQGPRGIKAFWLYNEKTLKNLLDIVAAMSDQGTAARGFDLCVNVLSMDFDITKLFPSFKNDEVWKVLQAAVSEFFPSEVLALLQGKLPPVIVLYAQWCPVGDQQKYDEHVDSWFQKFRAFDGLETFGCVHFDEFPADMAHMVGHWLFPQRREFPRPYVKRTYSTNSRTLGKDDWVKKLVKQVSKVCNPFEKLDDANEKPVPNPLYDNCKISAQIQCFGGENSMFYKNRDNGAAYSWRDSTVLQTVDCWYLNKDQPNYKQSEDLANKWQTENDGIMIGADSCFSKTDRRVLWGSWGDWDMAKPEVWKTYYEDEAKYQRLGKARMAADPDGIFTANPFAVARQS